MGIRKCYRKCDKMWHVLQSVTESVAKCDGIAKCDRKLLLSVTIITKWDTAPSSGSSSFSCGYNNEPNDS